MTTEPASRVDHPTLTPQLCFSTSALKGAPHFPRNCSPATHPTRQFLTAMHADFLRLSRSQIDDTITQNLNALNTPASQKFDPSSLTTPSRTLPGRSVPLPADSCASFATNVLFPSWQSRSDVLNYCASVATSDDPNDPDSLTRMAQSQADRERIVDERLDPYSGRFFPKESRTEILASVVRTERAVEEIVRNRTWGVVKERCGSAVGEEWREELDKWRRERDTS